MNKIPVIQTIKDSYRFTFGGLGTVIGLIWLPIILLTIGRYFSLNDSAIETTDPSIQGPIMVRGLVFDIVALILLAMIAVAIVREILKPVKRPSYLRFALGATELRVAAGYIGLFALMFVFLLGVILLVSLGAVVGKVAAGAAGSAIAAAIGGLVSLIGLCALIFIFVRLSFLLVPTAAIDGGFGLEKSWTLTKGNFWRIVVINIVTLLPISLVAAGASLAVISHDILNLHFVITQNQAVQTREIAAIMRVIAAHGPVLMGIGFLLAPFTYGMFFAPPAFAYRALKGNANALPS